MKRRTFLKVGSGTAVLVGAGGAGMITAAGKWGSVQQRLEHFTFASIEQRIQSYFPYLTISSEELGKFGDAHRAFYGGFFARPDDDLYERFLLSTDFFLNDGDEQQPLRFVALYHPSLNPCWNPCAVAGARAVKEGIQGAAPEEG